MLKFFSRHESRKHLDVQDQFDVKCDLDQIHAYKICSGVKMDMTVPVSTKHPGPPDGDASDSSNVSSGILSTL